MNSSKEPSHQAEHVCSLGSAPEWQPVYLTSEMYASLISVSAINLLVCPCSIFLNIFVMIAVKTSPRLRNNCNILLAALAGTDLMTSVFGQPLYAAEQIHRLTGSWENQSVCILRFIRDANVSFSVPASIQLLAHLSLERYIAIKFTFKYHVIVTKRRVIALAVFAWSVAAFLAVSTAFNSFVRYFIIIASICILIFCQIAVYREARNHMRRIKAGQVNAEAKQTFLKERKALITTTIVIGTVLFSYLPLISFRLVLEPQLSSPIVKYILESAFRSFLLCNSVCNPLIYCVRNSGFRRAFKRLWLGQNEVQPA